MEKITIDSIDDLISSEEFVLLEFGSKMCSPCIAIASKINAYLKEREMIKFKYIELMENQALAAKFSVFSAPTLLLYVDGKMTVRESGCFSIDKVFSDIERYIEIKS